ncbi:hypothetical protein V6B14_19165 [Sporosarcina psychrophila]
MSGYMIGCVKYMLGWWGIYDWLREVYARLVGDMIGRVKYMLGCRDI